MLYSDAELELAGPIRAGSSYGKIIRETENPRDIELRVFEQVTADLEDAALPDAPVTARIAAAHRNRELWLTLTCDVANEGNTLPDSLRASIISLGLWVFRETQNVIRGTTSMANMITINRTIMRGLRSQAQGAD